MRYVLLGLFGLAIATAVALWVVTAPRPAFTESMAAELEKPGEPARGKVVFDAGGCASCHASPGQTDRHRLGGGLALGSPFGTFHVPNISPDRQDGIGAWRTLDLANALMSGVSPKHQHYYPALPYTDYAHMRVEDARDLMAYLRTLPPVSGRAPPHELAFPLSVRRFVGLWKLLYLDRSPVKNDPAQSPEWNRGLYLVTALDHCGACHSSRNLIGGVEPKTLFAGGPDQDGVGFVPNITPAGIGHWAAADLRRALTTGLTPGDRPLGSTMAEVVTDVASLPGDDQQAIVTYIRSLPSRPTPSP
ncbi:MAG: c-type cytochrome [Alphaproteobacteria bacterium]|nr:c-type cytochrome [Alphaproteobacteria bacterium]